MDSPRKSSWTSATPDEGGIKFNEVSFTSNKTLEPRKASLRKRPSIAIAESATNATGDELLQGLAPPAPILSFWDRYFCKSQALSSSVETALTWNNAQAKETYSEPKASLQRFSFLSIGFLISLILIVMLLSLVIALAVALTLSHKTQHSYQFITTAPSIDAPGTYSSTSSPTIHTGTLPTALASVSADGRSGEDGHQSTTSLATSTSHSTTHASAASPPMVLKQTSVAVASSGTSPSSSVPAASNSQAYTRTKPPVRLAVLANFPDPAIYWSASDSQWYAFGTNAGAGILDLNPGATIVNTANLQIATSPDFENWTLLPAPADLLPSTNAWTASSGGNVANSATKALPRGSVWAPDIIYNPDTGLYILYYAASSSSSTIEGHCIGAATAKNIQGPFSPLASSIACPLSSGGAIDPTAFIDPIDSSIHVVYKVDGNNRGHGGECGNTVAPQIDTPIVIQQMLSDGTSPDLQRPAQTLLSRTPEDGPLIEAPALAKVGNVYYLFYSSGCTRNSDYTLRYATATTLQGPYIRAIHPLLQTGSYNLTAPGSVSVRYASGTTSTEQMSSVQSTGWVMAFHGRTSTDEGGVRAMFTSGLSFDISKRTVSLVDAGVAT